MLAFFRMAFIKAMPLFRSGLEIRNLRLLLSWRLNRLLSSPFNTGVGDMGNAMIENIFVKIRIFQ